MTCTVKVGRKQKLNKKNLTQKLDRTQNPNGYARGEMSSFTALSKIQCKDKQSNFEELFLLPSHREQMNKSASNVRDHLICTS